MKLSDFQFELPNKLLAQRPSQDRDESRLMVLYRKEEKIEHHIFKDIINFFDEDDVMILNNTKVFPARLFGNKEKTGARIEVFLLRELNKEQRLWDVLVDPARKIRIGNKLYFGDDDSLVAEVIDNTTSRGRTLRFLFDGSYEQFRIKLKELGQTPLPKYIKKSVMSPLLTWFFWMISMQFLYLNATSFSFEWYPSGPSVLTFTISLLELIVIFSLS